MLRPLAPRSVSLRVYPHDLPPRDLVAEVGAQARLAEEARFDGIMTAEHHGGFPNYLPNPLLMATWVLEATAHLWAAPCPLLLPLRPWTQVAEDVAWTAHRFPGRVAAGFAAGAVPVDFELAGVPFDEALPRFRDALPRVVAALTGRAEGPLAADPAIAALAADPLALARAVQAPAAVRSAARLGIAPLYNSLQALDRIRAMSEEYAAAGGTAARVLIRRVWVGDPPRDAVDAQMARYRGVATDQAVSEWAEDDGTVHATDGTEVAERLHATLLAAGCDTLNLRVFVAGLGPGPVRDQIGRLGAEVLPMLRRLQGAEG